MNYTLCTYGYILFVYFRDFNNDYSDRNEIKITKTIKEINNVLKNYTILQNTIATNKILFRACRNMI